MNSHSPNRRLRASPHNLTVSFRSTHHASEKPSLLRSSWTAHTLENRLPDYNASWMKLQVPPLLKMHIHASTGIFYILPYSKDNLDYCSNVSIRARLFDAVMVARAGLDTPVCSADWTLFVQFSVGQGHLHNYVNKRTKDDFDWSGFLRSLWLQNAHASRIIGSSVSISMVALSHQRSSWMMHGLICFLSASKGRPASKALNRPLMRYVQ